MLLFLDIHVGFLSLFRNKAPSWSTPTNECPVVSRHVGPELLLYTLVLYHALRDGTESMQMQKKSYIN